MLVVKLSRFGSFRFWYISRRIVRVSQPFPFKRASQTRDYEVLSELENSNPLQ
jgi:hypothetical protein